VKYLLQCVLQPIKKKYSIGRKEKAKTPDDDVLFYVINSEFDYRPQDLFRVF
jgi:hypothetical protein